MRHADGARLFRGEPFHFFLSLLVSTLGTRPAIAFLRVIAAFLTIAALSMVATFMWLLPSAIDAAIAFFVAGAWALWLDKREEQ